jgi:hypothetical protein
MSGNVNKINAEKRIQGEQMVTRNETQKISLK